MSETDYIQALKDNANGRSLCNCSQAYYNENGVCEYGCSANRIYASYELVTALHRQLEEARKALGEMKDVAQPTSEMIDAGAALLLETEAWYYVTEQTRDLAKRVFLAMQAASRAMGEDT